MDTPTDAPTLRTLAEVKEKEANTLNTKLYALHRALEGFKGNDNLRSAPEHPYWEEGDIKQLVAHYKTLLLSL